MNFTMTTDTAADWKPVGAEGGVKQTKCLLTYAPAHLVTYINQNRKSVIGSVMSMPMTPVGCVTTILFLVMMHPDKFILGSAIFTLHL